jgi:hypothetical protein
MADFSLTTLFVVPVGQIALPSSGSTQNLSAGTVGIFRSDYTLATSANIAAKPYFYVAQGRENTYLQGSKRSDKISSTGANVTEWYNVVGYGTPVNQITDVTDFSVQCGDTLTLTLRADSSYLRTLYFNGFTRSVTIQAPCCDCGDDPCVDVDVDALIAQLIAKLTAQAPGINPDNISLNKFYTFAKVGTGPTAILRITGKALTAYGQPCDVAAFPFEYDRMSFRTFVYSGPATTADFIVDDNCNIVANATITQRSSYATGTSAEIAQLEKNFYSYQAGYLKHLYRMNGYNENFETYVSAGITYDTYYIKFNEYDKSAYQWGDYIHEDSTVIIAAPKTQIGGAANPIGGLIETVLEAALGTLVVNNNAANTTPSGNVP